MVAAGPWLNPPPLFALGLEQITQLAGDGLQASVMDAGGQTVESRVEKFCNRLRGVGNIVSKPIVTVALSETSTGIEWQKAFDAAFNRAKIEILKYRGNQIKAANQNGLDSTITNGQTEMNSLASQESTSRAAATLVGLTVVASFTGQGENNQPTLGLCVIANRDLQEMVERLAKTPSEIKLNPSLVSPLEPIDSLTPLQLSNLFGSRFLSDRVGHPLVMAFGQAVVNYKGSSEPIRAKFRETAVARAEANADQQIAEYLAGEALYSDQQLSSQLIEISTSDSSESQKIESMEKIASDLSSRVKINLTGISSLRKWILPASKTAPERVGVVRLWQPLE